MLLGPYPSQWKHGLRSTNHQGAVLERRPKPNSPKLPEDFGHQEEKKRPARKSGLHGRQSVFFHAASAPEFWPRCNASNTCNRGSVPNRRPCSPVQESFFRNASDAYIMRPKYCALLTDYDAVRNVRHEILVERCPRRKSRRQNKKNRPPETDSQRKTLRRKFFFSEGRDSIPPTLPAKGFARISANKMNAEDARPIFQSSETRTGLIPSLFPSFCSSPVFCPSPVWFGGSGPRRDFHAMACRA